MWTCLHCVTGGMSSTTNSSTQPTHHSARMLLRVQEKYILKAQVMRHQGPLCSAMSWIAMPTLTPNRYFLKHIYRILHTIPLRKRMSPVSGLENSVSEWSFLRLTTEKFTYRRWCRSRPIPAAVIQKDEVEYNNTRQALLKMFVPNESLPSVTALPDEERSALETLFLRSDCMISREKLWIVSDTPQPRLWREIC